MAKINSGDITKLIDAIEAGQHIVLEFSSEEKAKAKLSAIRSKLYRDRRAMGDIAVDNFNPFSSKITFKFSHNIEIPSVWELELKLNTEEPEIYTWKVLD